MNFLLKTAKLLGFGLATFIVYRLYILIYNVWCPNYRALRPFKRIILNLLIIAIAAIYIWVMRALAVF